MDIRTTFFEALLSQPKLASSRKPEEFLGTSFATATPLSSIPLYLLSEGAVTATFPWTFDIGGLDCFLLLYTKNGGGKLQVEGNNYELTPSSLLFLNCNQHIRFDITADPWEYQVYFIKGPLLGCYNDLLPDSKFLLTTVSSYSDIMMALEKLPPQLSHISLSTQLHVSDLLNHVITGCLMDTLQEKPFRQISSYIKDMKKLFDEEYQEPYSLDDLEERLGISKYRLCREFSAAYDLSPLQYLNKRRIEVAAYLLQTSNHRVHEIGSMVGIENTNHFIHLFKKFLNCTPSEYKQRMTK